MRTHDGTVTGDRCEQPQNTTRDVWMLWVQADLATVLTVRHHFGARAFDLGPRYRTLGTLFRTLGVTAASRFPKAADDDDMRTPEQARALVVVVRCLELLNVSGTINSWIDSLLGLLPALILGWSHGRLSSHTFEFQCTIRN